MTGSATVPSIWIGVLIYGLNFGRCHKRSWDQANVGAAIQKAVSHSAFYAGLDVGGL